MYLNSRSCTGKHFQSSLLLWRALLKFIVCFRFGVCCLFIYSTTGSTISQNCSYVQSPSFPSTFTSSTSSSLTYTIAKCSNDVCALRIDFLTFSTVRDTAATPDEANACADIFTITVSFFLFSKIRPIHVKL